LRCITCLQTRIEIHLIFYDDSTYFHKLKTIPDKSSAIVLEVFEEWIKELQNESGAQIELTAAANTKVNSVHSSSDTPYSMNLLLPILLNPTAKLKG
jgi:predicted Zn-dependent peptidase